MNRQRLNSDLAISTAPATARRGSRSRGGTILIFAVIFLFVLFSLGAMVVDLGLASVTQSRMASASDSSALEGLRWRDQFPDTMTDPNLADPTQEAAARDQARREAAASLASIIFSDNNPPQPGDAQFGAGPLFQQTPGTFGTPEENLGGILLPGSPTVYKPELQFNNILNADSGDIVAGTYITTVTVSHREGYDTGPGSDQFSRDDFTVSSPSDAPGSTSLLVRMRQSRDAVVAGVSSSGPAIPYLFGRGAFLSGTANASGYAPRRDGITVRSTSIANAIPTVYVGTPIAASAVAGVGNLAFTSDLWENVLLPVDGAGAAHPVTVTLDSMTNVLTGPDGVDGMSLASVIQTLGAAPVAGAAALPTTFSGYFPIYQQIPSGLILVIGFGWAEVDVTGVSGSVTTLSITKLCMAGGGIAPRNASADLRFAWSTLGVLSASDLAAVQTANSTLADPLLSPVLVRSMSN